VRGEVRRRGGSKVRKDCLCSRTVIIIRHRAEEGNREIASRDSLAPVESAQLTGSVPRLSLFTALDSA
jgi:hypothetical protein